MKLLTYALGLSLLILPLNAAAAPQENPGAAKSAALQPVQTEAYPPYLDGNPAYPLIETRRGTAWYLDTASIFPELYSPPEYILSAYVVKLDEAVSDSNSPIRMVPLRFRYNSQTLTMYYDREPGKNLWSAITPFSGWLRTGVVLPAGEAAYYLFYEEKFLGKRQYPINVNGQIADKDYPLPESFYQRLKLM